MLILRYVDDLPALCLDSSSEARRGPRAPGTGVTESCKPPCRCWESNQGPVEEQSGFITAEPCEPQVLCP